MNQRPPAYQGQYQSHTRSPQPLPKEQVYPQLLVTETPAKPHSYDDDTAAPMKPQAYDETPTQPPPPSYPISKPNAFDNTQSQRAPALQQERDPKGPSSSIASLKKPLQARNSSRSAPMLHDPEVGSNISHLGDDDEQEASSSGFLSAFQRKVTIKRDGPRDPLNSLPECFDRKPEFPSPPSQFATFWIPSSGKFLDHGFPKAFPSAQLGSHDIYPEDWTRFLEDVAIMGRLTGGQKVVSSVFPITQYVGFAGHHLTKAIEKSMKKGKHSKVASLVDIWNAVFFNQRGVNVVLLRGSKRISGPPIEEPSYLSPTASSFSSSQSFPSPTDQTASPYSQGSNFSYDPASPVARRNSMESLSSKSSFSSVNTSSTYQKSPVNAESHTSHGSSYMNYHEPEQHSTPQAPLLSTLGLPTMSQLIPQTAPMSHEEYVRYMPRESSRRERRHIRQEQKLEKKNEKYYIMVEYRVPGV